MEIWKWEGVRFLQASAAAWAAAAASLAVGARAGQITTTLHAPRIRPATETRRGGRSGTVAAAKREALKAKRRKAHKRRVR